MKIRYRTIGEAVVSIGLLLATGCAVPTRVVVYPNVPHVNYQVHNLEQRARHGDAIAQYTLGAYYAIGRGVPKDPMQAAHWYRLSAQQGYAPAQNRLGVCYAIGIGVGKDYTEAVRWYRLSADQGNAIAQNNLGGCYYKGHGVAQDYAESERWYRKAAAQGNLAAQRNLSFYFERGSGGAGTPISQTVQDKATAPSQPSLTVDEIKEQGSQGFKADSIVANIKETNSKFSPQDIAAAEQADPPLDAEVIKCMKDNLR